jgi:hypothetical protein
LSQTYSQIFRINGQDVELHNGIESAVLTEKPITKSTEDDQRISLTITITNAEIKRVQSFLWRLCEEAVLNKLEFNDLHATQHNEFNKGVIRVNEIHAMLTIVQQTFRFLFKDPEDSTKSLGPRLLDYLPQHLETLRQVTETDEKSDEKLDENMQSAFVDIGKNLFELLHSRVIIETHWNSCTRLVWFGSERELDIFWDWLNDSNVISGLHSLQKKRLEMIKSSSNRNRALLMPIMQMIAENWLRDRKWKVEDTFRWISGYLELVCSTCSILQMVVTPLILK